jgi:predicted GIY-YIG superfamily endonuclease
MIYKYNDLKSLTKEVSGIYLICHKNNLNLIYIGMSTNIFSRWNEHIKNPKRSGARQLTEAFHKYGLENFYFLILEETKTNLLQREIFWIKNFNSVSFGLNGAVSVNDIPKDLKSLGGKITAEKSRRGECNTFFDTKRAKKAAQNASGARKVWKIKTASNQIYYCLGLKELSLKLNINQKTLNNWASSLGTINYKKLKGFSIERIEIKNKSILGKNRIYTEDEIIELKMGELLERLAI